MTSAEFSLLPETIQTEILLEKGVFIAERLYKNFIIFLYQVDQFYVELYHNLRFNVIQGMRSFEDQEALDPFLQEIDISCLYR